MKTMPLVATIGLIVSNLAPAADTDTANFQMQQNYIQARFAAHTTEKKRAHDPSTIPLGSKVSSFFRRYTSSDMAYGESRERLSSTLSLNEFDLEELVSAAAAERDFELQLSVRSSAAMQDLCKSASISTDGVVDIVAFGAQMTALDDADEQERTSHYEKILSALSDDGRAKLLAMIDREIAPTLTYGRIDWASLFAEFPNEFSVHMAVTCRSLTSPPHNSSSSTTKEMSGGVNQLADGK
jgi:hypothetical protein